MDCIFPRVCGGAWVWMVMCDVSWINAVEFTINSFPRFVPIDL